jgi:hypothetical protein
VNRSNWREELSKINNLKMLMSIRGVGNTTAMLQGFERNMKSALIVATEADRKMIFSMLGRKVESVIPMENVDRLRAFRGPVLIDHHAIDIILDRMFNAIACQSSEYHESLSRVLDENNALSKRIEALESQNLTLKSKIERNRISKKRNGGK